METLWNDLSESVKTRSVELEHRNRSAIEDLRTELLGAIEEAKQDSVLAELKKITGRLDKLEARLPEPEEEA